MRKIADGCSLGIVNDLKIRFLNRQDAKVTKKGYFYFLEINTWRLGG